MPRGDRTGPLGLGPRSGRGAGYCAGYGSPGFVNPGPFFGFGYGYGRGQGAGFGLGRGRGFRRCFFAQPFGWGYQYGAQYIPVPTQFGSGDEKAFLAGEAKILKDQLSQIEKRLSELEVSGNEG